MPTFVLRLIPPRPSFALDMTDEERDLMGRHAQHWQPLIESGEMVVFGPVNAESGSWGLSVIDTDDGEKVRALAADDPVATSGTGEFEVGELLAGYVRPR